MAIGPSSRVIKDKNALAARKTVDALTRVVASLESDIDRQIIKADSRLSAELKIKVKKPLTFATCGAIGKNKLIFDSLLERMCVSYLMSGWQKVVIESKKVSGAGNHKDKPGFVKLKIVFEK